MKNELQTVENVNDKTLIEYLDVMGISPKLEEKEKIQFLNIAKTFGLNPFKREIFCTVYGEGQVPDSGCFSESESRSESLRAHNSNYFLGVYPYEITLDGSFFILKSEDF